MRLASTFADVDLIGTSTCIVRLNRCLCLFHCSRLHGHILPSQLVVLPFSTWLRISANEMSLITTRIREACHVRMKIT
jgi:hypothetical protein